MKRIDSASNELLPGPPALFVCGYRSSDHNALTLLLEGAKLDCPVIWCDQDMAPMRLGEALSLTGREPVSTFDELPPVILFSGITMSQAQLFMTLFKEASLRRAIFATTTESNLDFTIKELLLHLIQEQMEMAKAAGHGNIKK